MYNTKLNIVFLLLVTFLSVVLLPAYSACTKRQKNSICNACETQALNSSECMATNSCSTCTQCIQEAVEEVTTNLNGDYNLTVDLFTRGTHNYKLSIKSTKLNPTTGLMQFDYSTNHLNSGFTYTGVGFIKPGLIHFALPVKIISSSAVPSIFVGELYSLSCSVLVESDNLIKLGSCESIDTNTIPSSGELTGISGAISSFSKEK